LTFGLAKCVSERERMPVWSISSGRDAPPYAHITAAYRDPDFWVKMSVGVILRDGVTAQADDQHKPTASMNERVKVLRKRPFNPIHIGSPGT